MFDEEGFGDGFPAEEDEEEEEERGEEESDMYYQCNDQFMDMLLLENLSSDDSIGHALVQTPQHRSSSLLSVRSWQAGSESGSTSIIEVRSRSEPSFIFSSKY